MQPADVASATLAARSFPNVCFVRGAILPRPSGATLGRELGVYSQVKSSSLYLAHDVGPKLEAGSGSTVPVQPFPLVQRVGDGLRQVDGGSREAGWCQVYWKTGKEAEHAVTRRVRRCAEIEPVTPRRIGDVRIPGFHCDASIRLGHGVTNRCSPVEAGMVDVPVDDEQRVEHKPPAVEARPEQDYRSGRQMSQLGGSAVGELAAPRVMKSLSEDERVGVLQAKRARWTSVVRLEEVEWTVFHTCVEVRDDSRLRLPFSPDQEIGLVHGTLYENPPAGSQEFPAVRGTVPGDSVAVVGPVLPTGMDELNEAAALKHKEAP